MSRQHGFLYHANQRCTQLVKVYVVTQGGIESSKSLFSVIFAAIEPTIYHILDTSAQRGKQRGNCQRGNDNGKIGALSSYSAKYLLSQHYSAEVHCRENRS